jgi:hypothetical protein
MVPPTRLRSTVVSVHQAEVHSDLCRQTEQVERELLDHRVRVTTAAITTFHVVLNDPRVAAAAPQPQEATPPVQTISRVRVVQDVLFPSPDRVLSMEVAVAAAVLVQQVHEQLLAPVVLAAAEQAEAFEESAELTALVVVAAAPVTTRQLMSPSWVVMVETALLFFVM